MRRDGIVNYIKTDIVATGIVRPKTTALFFDKIWIPTTMKYTTFGSLLGYDIIPNEVCLLEEIKEPEFSHFLHRNIGPMDTVEDIIIHYKEKTKLKYENVKYRNFGLVKVIKAFKEYYDIDIVPIFLNENDFEQSINPHILNEHESIIKENKEFYEKISDKFTKLYNEDVNGQYHETDYLGKEIVKHEQTCNAIRMSFNMVPEIIEDKLDWKQVLEIRKDKKSINSLHRFRNWVNLELLNKSESEIISSLESAYDNYKFAIKKHGIATIIGGFTTILSGTAVVFDSIKKGDFNFISIGFPITAGIITLTAKEIIEYIETKRTPIAYVYNIINKT
jgi:hypothetical protein